MVNTQQGERLTHRSPFSFSVSIPWSLSFSPLKNVDLWKNEDVEGQEEFSKELVRRAFCGGLCLLGHLSRVWLCDLMDGSPPGSSVRWILQARILECVALPSSRGASWPRDRTCASYIPSIGGRFFTTSTAWFVPYSSGKGGLKLWNREKCFAFLLSCAVFSRPSHLTAHLSVLSSWLKCALKITNWHNCIAFPPNSFFLFIYTTHTCFFFFLLYRIFPLYHPVLRSGQKIHFTSPGWKCVCLDQKLEVASLISYE